MWNELYTTQLNTQQDGRNDLNISSSFVLRKVVTHMYN